MSRLYNGPLTFSGDKSAQHEYAYFPEVLGGESVEFGIYVMFSHGSAAGKIQIQTAPTRDYSGVWSNVGSTMDWAAQDSTKHVFLTAAAGALRLDIDTAVTTGTVSGWLVAARAD